VSLPRGLRPSTSHVLTSSRSCGRPARRRLSLPNVHNGWPNELGFLALKFSRVCAEPERDVKNSLVIISPT
jgi:hypothetical protein